MKSEGRNDRKDDFDLVPDGEKSNYADIPQMTPF